MPWLEVILSAPRGASCTFLSASSACARRASTSLTAGIEHLAFVGEREAARMTLEQRRGDFFFQRADLAADGRLAERQHLAGMGEAARRGDRVKDAKLVPVHLRYLFRAVFLAALTATCNAKFVTDHFRHVRPPENVLLPAPPCSPCPPRSPPGGRPCPSRRPAANTPATLVWVESGAVLI